MLCANQKIKQAVCKLWFYKSSVVMRLRFLSVELCPLHKQFTGSIWKSSETYLPICCSGKPSCCCSRSRRSRSSCGTSWPWGDSRTQEKVIFSSRSAADDQSRNRPAVEEPRHLRGPRRWAVRLWWYVKLYQNTVDTTWISQHQNWWDVNYFSSGLRSR